MSAENGERHQPDCDMMASCSYITTMILLIADYLCNLEHDEIEQDGQLVDAAIL